MGSSLTIFVWLYHFSAWRNNYRIVFFVIKPKRWNLSFRTREKRWMSASNRRVQLRRLFSMPRISSKELSKLQAGEKSWNVFLTTYKRDFYFLVRWAKHHEYLIFLLHPVQESRQPWANFQFPFFLVKSTIKNEKTNLVASQYNFLALL